MLTAAPPGQSTRSVNRQLPQSLAVPGLQRQGFGGGGAGTLFGHYPGVTSGAELRGSDLVDQPNQTFGQIPQNIMAQQGPLAMMPPSPMGTPPMGMAGTSPATMNGALGNQTGFGAGGFGNDPGQLTGIISALLNSGGAR